MLISIVYVYIFICICTYIDSARVGVRVRARARARAGTRARARVRGWGGRESVCERKRDREGCWGGGSVPECARERHVTDRHKSRDTLETNHRRKPEPQVL